MLKSYSKNSCNRNVNSESYITRNRLGLLVLKRGSCKLTCEMEYGLSFTVNNHNVSNNIFR